MAQLVYGLNVTLDGYVDHESCSPSARLFRHFIEHARGLAGSLYGRRMYEVMRYWDADCADWSGPEREFAQAWRSQHKWVVSRSLASVGPNATLISTELESTVRQLKTRLSGELEVAGPELAQSLTALGLIDAYRLYVHPVVLGRGKPYFAGLCPPLRLSEHEMIDEKVIRLTYVPLD